MEKAAAVVLVLLSTLVAAHAADPELTADFAADSSKIDASFFAFTGFRGGVTAPSGQFLVKRASVTEFPGLEGQGISYAKLSFQSGAVNPPHTHPRGAELLYVEQGSIIVGLLDSTNKLFVQKLLQGDVFVFPKGLAHFQMNEGKSEAKAISAFSSANAGTISIPAAIFNSNINDAVLAKSFKVPLDTISLLKTPVSTQ